jgi:hypothetical protein
VVQVVRAPRGMPIRDYRADVDLQPSQGGTTIRWRSSFRPKVPGTGWFYRLVLRRFIRDTAGRVAAHAASSSPPPIAES